MASQPPSHERTLSQPLLGPHLSRDSSLTGPQSIPGRSARRKYRCWPSSAGLDPADISESEEEPKTPNGRVVTPQIDEETGHLASTQSLHRSYRRLDQRVTAGLAAWFTQLVQFPITAYLRVKGDPSTAILACKVGVSCCLMSVLVMFEEDYPEIKGLALWAVITIALVYEANIGASLSKGLNRVTGTFLAGALAVFVNHVGPLMGPFHFYFVLLSIFVVTWVPVFLRFGSSLKEHWNYALSMATITAHLLILSGYKKQEKLKMPVARFLMIVLGFLVAAFVNLLVKPKYAGNTLHKLVTKNFKTAADILEQCVESYLKGTELEPVPDILAGRMGGDEVHRMYDEIVMSDTEVDKLMNFVSWEPCHGRFFRGYPWGLYGDITDNLRYTVYTIIALDGCLRAEIQAPQVLRDIFANEMRELGQEVGKVLRILHQSLNEFRTFAISDILQQAEVSALLLQMRLHDNAHRLLMERARTPSVDEFWKLAPGLQYQAVEERTERHRYRPVEPPGAAGDGPGVENGSDNGTSETAGVLPEDGSLSEDDRPGLPKRPGDESPNAQAAWQREFFLRRDSLGRNWDGTLERIGAMSLVKFSSLLIELVAGLKFVVESVDMLSKQARFEGPDLSGDDWKDSQPSDLGDQRREGKEAKVDKEKGRRPTGRNHA
ncbi:Aluminium activated malate transporter family protein [Klebsormidium nitens]|uniref:Aluminium activated malate transporter family protein n=1 Tax=Klebsormidium nitens TaxID=105231 RepID=A0A1Y1I739_KLENI|nr:Aluminium activated malate transporter family protein [Klebsormidium nitens]|eukprot:GAQ85239.1 Aluminium activated malate transporter family protein [Klebsormidium nitens]